MKERPIIFSADMVSAILRGDKTQTRRVVKPQPPAEIDEFLPADPEGFWGFDCDNRPTLCIHCPFGEIGDRLRVTFASMPRTSSTTYITIRDKLKITSLRVERLQDISEEDARAEGAQEMTVLPGDRGSFVPDFAMRWEGIHGAGSWTENPWVWVITFRKVNK